MHCYSMILVKGPRRCMHKSLKVCLKPGPEAIFRWQDHIFGDIRRIGHTSTLVLANNFCPILIGIPHVSVGLHQDMALNSIETAHATVYNGNKCKVILVASHGLLNLTTPRHSFFLRSFESLVSITWVLPLLSHQLHHLAFWKTAPPSAPYVGIPNAKFPHLYRRDTVLQSKESGR